MAVTKTETSIGTVARLFFAKMKIKSVLIFVFLFFIAFSINAKKEETLTPFLKKSVSSSDFKKVQNLKNKARQVNSTDKQVKYYLEAAKLGDYDSQVAMGYYYGFNTCKPEYVSFDDNTLFISYPTIHRPIDKAAAWYFLQAASRNEDVSYYHEQANVGLAFLSLDSINDKKVADKIYERVLFSALVVEEYFLKDPRTYMWPYQRFKLAQNIGKILATLSMKGIGTEQDLIYAHYSSTWIKNDVNVPNEKPVNEISQKIIEYVGELPYSENNKKYGVGLVSTILLKKAADLYNKDVKNKEILFWVDRALYTDSNNSKAYYFVGNLYLNGYAGLLKDRKKAKKWFTLASNKGAEEAKAALAAIEEIEFAESEQKRAKDLAERRKAEERRQRRRQAWAQAIGTIVQAAGNAYMYSQGYTNNANLLNPNLAISQVQSQYSQLAALQQFSVQNIQMPQFDFKWTTPPTFTVDWSQVNWSSTPIDSYYQYQGDLVNNGVETTVQSNTNQSSFTNTGTSSDKTCHLCHGTKKCWTCGGNRTYINPLTNKRVACPNCTNGWCSRCNGTGRL